MTMAVIQHSNLQTENILLLLLVFILSCVYLWKRSVSSFPEGPWSIPFTKNQKLLHARPHIRLTQLRDVYGEIFSVKLGRQRAVVVSSFEGLNEGLVKKAFTLSGRPGSLLSGVFNKVSYNFFQIRERSEIQMAYQRDIVNRHKDCFNPNIVSDLVDCSLVMLELNEDSGVLSQEDLDGIFVELCSSGNQPISATLAWLILYVSYFPDVQDKIYQELTSVMGIERSPRMSDQPHLPYTCAVILETQRLATVLPFMYPHMATEDTQFMGYKIPKDTAMLFNGKVDLEGEMMGYVLAPKPFSLTVTPRETVVIDIAAEL
ncbi:CP1A1-like protein, partial [Mya arenaria]